MKVFESDQISRHITSPEIRLLVGLGLEGDDHLRNSSDVSVQQGKAPTPPFAFSSSLK
jgi:hypothetical protein